MGEHIEDLIELPASEEYLSRYKALALDFSWERELKNVFRSDGLTNISVCCLEGFEKKRAGNHKVFEIITSPADLPHKEVMDSMTLEEQTRRLAAGFKRKLNIQPAEPVAIHLPVCQELVLSVLAIPYIGAIASPILDIFKKEPLKSRLINLRPRVLITTEELIDGLELGSLDFLHVIVLAGKNSSTISLPYNKTMVKFDGLLENNPVDPVFVSPDHPFIIHYTPGTLGEPKGIIHAHRSLIGYYYSAKWVLRLNSSAIIWCTAHPGWIPGSVYGIFAPLLCASQSLLTASDVDLSIPVKSKTTTIYTTPSTLARLTKSLNSISDGQKLATVKILATTGERIQASVVRESEKAFGKTILDTWWMTETGMITISNFPMIPVKPGSIGLPLPGIKPLIIDENGKELGNNTLGILAFEGKWPTLMMGIWGNEKGEEGYFLNNFFVTSDYAYRDEDGYFWFQGRSEEFIRKDGAALSLVEIEEVLCNHPGISECAVIGLSRAGKKILKAFIVLAPGFEPGEEVIASINDWVRDNMGNSGIPDEISFIRNLPKTKVGKVLKRALMEMETGKNGQHA